MSGKIKTTRYNLAAILICTFVFIVSLILGHFHEIGTFGVETDFYGTYAIQAENILSGKPYTYEVNPPGYPILIALISILTGDLFVAGKILSALSIALFMLTCYFIFKKLFTERIALVSIIFLGLTLFPYSFTAATDMVGAAFTSIPILILLKKDEIKNGTSLIIGIACGAAYLIRADSIFVFLGITFSILFIIQSESWKKKFIKISLLITGYIIITSPWFIYNWKLNGSPFATGAYDQIGYHLYDWKESEEIVEQITEKSKSPEVLLIKPIQLVLNYIKNIPSRLELFALSGSPFPLYLFLGGGIFFFLKNLNRKRLTYFLIWFTGFILVGLISFKVRHYFVLIPFASLLVTYFFFNPAFSDSSLKTNLLIWVIIIFSAFFLVKKAYVDIKIFLNSEPRYLVQAADFLRSRSSKDDIVVARKPHLAYLAGLKNIFLFEYFQEEFYNKSKFINARYIVYSDFEAELWPGLNVLQNPENIKDYFTLVYQHKPTNTLIYEIK